MKKTKSIRLEKDLNDVDIKEWVPFKKKKSKKSEQSKPQLSQKDIEALSKSTYTPKTRQIVKLDQEKDIIYFREWFHLFFTFQNNFFFLVFWLWFETLLRKMDIVSYVKEVHDEECVTVWRDFAGMEKEEILSSSITWSIEPSKTNSGNSPAAQDQNSGNWYKSFPEQLNK